MEKVRNFFFISTILALPSAILMVGAMDPDILNDYLVPPGLNPNNITSQYFTYTAFRQLKNANFTGLTATVAEATMKEFPALEGHGVSLSIIIYPPQAMNLPHIHPRSAELLMVLDGSLEVGFVDTNNKLFNQTLQTPDLFIFPKGLVHFQVNRQNNYTFALGVFGSASPGTVSIPSNVFGSGIGAEILAKAFKTDEQTISKLIQANQ